MVMDFLLWMALVLVVVWMVTHMMAHRR